MSRDFEVGINVSCEKSTVNPVPYGTGLIFNPKIGCHGNVP